MYPYKLHITNGYKFFPLKKESLVDLYMCCLLQSYSVINVMDARRTKINETMYKFSNKICARERHIISEPAFSASVSHDLLRLKIRR